MKKTCFFTFLILTAWITVTAQSDRKDQIFLEYQVEEFDFQDRHAKVVFPDKADKDRHWIWRARFWGHEPQLDKALLNHGFHLVYVDVAGLYGNDQAVEIWNAFYEFVQEKYKLNEKVVLEGMSRGGLIVYNWASRNVNKLACIYADAPVCDIKSWPGGLYQGKGSPSDWEECLKVYNLDEESVGSFYRIPIFCAIKVAKAGIPSIHVCGADDKVVPYDENTKKLAENFEKAGGTIKIILKEGVGHHPHSLEDPKPILDFILEQMD